VKVGRRKLFVSVSKARPLLVNPKAGESAKMKAKRKSFKSRHGKNIAKGKMSAAYWADKVKW
jgi:hypothetical protein